MRNWWWRKAGPSWSWAFLLVAGVALASCKPDPKVEAPEIRPVRTVTAAKGETAETAVLTGHVQAEDEPALAFRIGGRVIERPVNVGDRVEAGQVLAKLDPENQLNELRSAESALAAAQGQLTHARGDFDRQRQLLAKRPHASSPVLSGITERPIRIR